MVKNASIARVVGWDAGVDAGAEGGALLALEAVVRDLFVVGRRRLARTLIYSAGRCRKGHFG